MSGTKSQPILVAVDFSPASQAALVWAAREAAATGRGLHVLHVVHDPESKPGYYTEATSEGSFLRPEEAARELLEGFLDETRGLCPELESEPGPPIHLVTGLPATRILEVADQIRASQIVVGSQGRTGLQKILLGSKALRVAQLSRIPVTIVKAQPANAEESLAS